MAIKLLTFKEILDLWNKPGDSIEECKSYLFGDSSVQVYEEQIAIKGCKYGVLTRKDGKIWVFQEPDCQKYQRRDINLYSVDRTEMFGICFNVKYRKTNNKDNPFGCALSKRVQCYFPTNRKKEGEILYSPPIRPHNCRDPEVTLA